MPNATEPVARVNPSATHVDPSATHAVVEIETRYGRISTAFVTDPSVREGVISMPHGHLDANPGDLTSGDDAVDQLTAMPRLSGLEVDVTGPDRTAL